MAFAVLGTPGSNLVPVAQAQASGTVIGGTFLPGIARAVQVAPPTATPGLDGLDGLPLVGTGPLSTVTAADVPTPAPALTAVPPLTTVTSVPALIVPPSAPTGTGIPATVLAAYKAAESSLAASDPACHLPWTLVAGIGRVESGNASGGRVDAAGTTRGRILGPLLDGGLGGTAVVRDTDGGSMDGNAQFDRAVGPMQFLPGTWKTYAKDGNHDGVADPHNVFDAALATGSYLCAGGSDLSQPIPERAALMRYNHSVAYGDLVLRWAAAYAAGVSALPDSAGEVPSAAPTPPEQVPAPTSGTSGVLALAAVDSGGSDSTTSSESETSTTSTSETSTSSTSATSTKTSSPSTTTSPTTTSDASTTPSTTPAPVPPVSSSTSPTSPTSSSSTVTTTPPSSSTTRTSTATTTPSRATSSSAPAPDPSTSDTTKTSTTKTSTTKTSTTKTTTTKTKTSAPETSAAKASSSAASDTTSAGASTTKKASAKTTTTKTTTKTATAKPDADTADGGS